MRLRSGVRFTWISLVVSLPEPQWKSSFPTGSLFLSSLRGCSSSCFLLTCLGADPKSSWDSFLRCKSLIPLNPKLPVEALLARPSLSVGNKSLGTDFLKNVSEKLGILSFWIPTDDLYDETKRHYCLRGLVMTGTLQACPPSASFNRPFHSTTFELSLIFPIFQYPLHGIHEVISLIKVMTKVNY